MKKNVGKKKVNLEISTFFLLTNISNPIEEDKLRET